MQADMEHQTEYVIEEDLARLSIAVVLVYRVFEFEVALLKTVKSLLLIGEVFDELLLLVLSQLHVVHVLDAQFVT